MISYKFDTFCKEKPLAGKRINLAIGVFDGVHKGHLCILNHCLVEKYKESLSVVMTFNVNPKMRAGKITKNLPLTTYTQRRAIFEEMGFDREIVIDFSVEFSKLSADKFFDLITDSVILDKVIVGEDFRCGEPSTSYGPIELQKYLIRKGLKTTVVVPSPVLDSRKNIISSTLIRKQLVQGNMDVVQNLLGRPYLLDLGSTPSHVSGNGLVMKREDIMQLLPLQGIYDAKLVGNGRHVTLKLSKNLLEIENVDPSLLQINRLEITNQKGI